LVNTWHIQSVIAAAITLAVAFVVRFVFNSLVVYRPTGAKKTAPAPARDTVDGLDTPAT
jgi:dolichol-phosphate mannosyltransferase